MKVLSNSFWLWAGRWLFIIGLAVVIALVSVLAGIQLWIFLAVAAGVGAWLFKGDTTCKDVCAFDFIFRFGGFLALCMMLYLLFFPLHETILDARKENVDIVAKIDPELSVFLKTTSPPFGMVALEPDEKNELAAIFEKGKSFGVMTVLWQKHVSATPQAMYSLMIGISLEKGVFSTRHSLRFDNEGRVLNARFSREDETKLTILIQNAAARL